MHRSSLILALFLYALFIGTTASARGDGEFTATGSTEAIAGHSWFGFFQLNGLLALTADARSYSLAPQVSWNPTFVVGPMVAVRADVGLSAMLVKDAKGPASNELLGHCQALLDITLRGQYLELGGGTQILSGAQGGTLPLATLGLAFPLGGVAPLERMFLQYSVSALHARAVHQLKLGVGVAF